MFLRAIYILVDALLASINKAMSLSSLERRDLILRVAGSMPAVCPAQSCLEPAAIWRSPFVMNTGLAIILLTVPQIPVGLTPGNRLIRQHTNRGESPFTTKVPSCQKGKRMTQLTSAGSTQPLPTVSIQAREACSSLGT